LIVANRDQIAKLDAGVEVWNQWRESQAITPDLSEVDFSGRDLSGVDFHGADLRGVSFSGANLSGAVLRDANLHCANLSGARKGLQTERLAGADLTGATLPEGLKKLYEGLQNVNNISESARKLFLAVLAACLYSWITIATTTDVNLITNRASSPLPIIGTSIPIVGFYAVTPLLLLCVYFYFHFYLQKLWEELSSLPAIFPDGRPLHAKIDPWLLNDLVRSHLRKLNVNRPFLSYFQLWISVLLAWWLVPITMVLFWARYLPRHEWVGTKVDVVLLMISVTAAVSLYQLAVATLRGAQRKPFRWNLMLKSRDGYQATALAAATGALFGIFSWGAIMGVPSDEPILSMRLLLRGGHASDVTGPLTWVPRLMALVGYSPFADLTGAEVSRRKSAWSENDYYPDSVAGAQLRGANLRYALASGAILAGADLSGADLCGANLGAADLRGALLTGASLRNANLYNADLRRTFLASTGGSFHFVAGGNDVFIPNPSTDLSGAELGDADLRGAQLYGANLSGAQLDGANLTYSDFRLPKLLGSEAVFLASNPDLEAVKRALHWDKAFYEDKTLKALGLPADHNVQLAEQQKKENELQQNPKSQ
jgi:uncharacterized protein YjbI with pentapeptide repeats